MKHPTFFLLELYQILRTDSSYSSPLSLNDLIGEFDGQFGEEVGKDELLQGLKDLDANGFTVTVNEDGKYFLNAPLLSRKELDVIEDSLYRDSSLSDGQLEDSVDLLESLLPYTDQRDLSLVLRGIETEKKDPSSLFDKIEFLEDAIVRSKKVDFLTDGKEYSRFKPEMLSLSKGKYLLTGKEDGKKEETLDIASVSSLKYSLSLRKKGVKK
jgi:hypothetical protein